MNHKVWESMSFNETSILNYINTFCYRRICFFLGGLLTHRVAGIHSFRVHACSRHVRFFTSYIFCFYWTLGVMRTMPAEVTPVPQMEENVCCSSQDAERDELSGVRMEILDKDSTPPCS